MMYCSYCGKALLDDAVFCFACGKRVAVPDWTAGIPEIPDAADCSADADEDGELAFATLQRFLRHILQGLPEPDRKILEMRFWLEEGSSYTMSEISESLHVTEDDIRRAEANALRLLQPLVSGK
ncbi:MAG: zinc-ribbon domain-containing protein [Treponema sp.]|nr:zinc-ribbon domain-containing protein [Treponema sp.]